MAETPQKTPMRTPAHGRGRLRVGGTNKGGTGRPPNTFRDRMASITDAEEFDVELRRTATDSSHRQYMSAVQFVAERAYGASAQSVDVNVKGQLKIVVVRE